MLFLLSIMTAFAWLIFETRCFTVRLAVGEHATQLPSYRFSRPQPFRSSGRKPIIAPVLISLVLVLFFLSPFFIIKLFFQMPKPSSTFDCDDSALLMVQRLNAAGIKTDAILGNLKMTGETYGQTNHVWALVKIGGLRLAFDWGTLWLDRQHYEGYVLTPEKLMFFVNQDSPSGRQFPAATLP